GTGGHRRWPRWRGRRADRPRGRRARRVADLSAATPPGVWRGGGSGRGAGRRATPLAAGVTRASTPQIGVQAARGGAGAGSFNVITIEHAEAIAQGADAARRHAILQISENAVRYHGGLAPIAAASLAVARAAEMPISVHLDHATEPTLVREAIGLGVSSVM